GLHVRVRRRRVRCRVLPNPAARPDPLRPRDAVLLPRLDPRGSLREDLREPLIFRPPATPAGGSSISRETPCPPVLFRITKVGTSPPKTTTTTPRSASTA